MSILLGTSIINLKTVLQEDTLYVSFKRADGDFKDEFLAFLDEDFTTLSGIIRNKKNSVKPKFFNSTRFGDDIIIVIIQGTSDFKLCQLGKAHGFPRGFPVVWNRATNTASYFGFYPKFENDDRQGDTSTLFDRAVSEARIFPKMSGFLSQLVTFEVEGSIFWTACSKNSAEGPFAEDGARLWQKYVTPELLQHLHEHNLLLCGEAMSKQDQCHGARVINESIVITCVGQRSDNAFPSFLSHGEVIDFCKDHALDCEGAMVLAGEELNDFFQELIDSRDYTTCSSYHRLCDKYHNSFIQGTVSHMDILGDVLEGLVIQLTYEDGTRETVKFKFPNYTMRTFGLRVFLKEQNLATIPLSSLQKVVDWWCVSDEGKDYWLNWLKACSVLSTTFEQSDEQVGLHIQLADTINSMTQEQVDNLSFIYNNNNQKTKVTLIVVVGPIGFGKSTAANNICVDEQFFHIDGDVLGLSMSQVLKMGQERQPYTFWCVIRAILEGKTPVLSTGGGVLFTQGREQRLAIISAIQQILPHIEVELVVFVPENYEEEYANTERTRAVIQRRIETGEWTDDTNVEKVVALSKGNLRFCKKLIEEADRVVTYTNTNTPSTFDELRNSISSSRPLVSFCPQQQRTLVEVEGIPKLLHITNGFFQDRPEMDYQEEKKEEEEEKLGRLVTLQTVQVTKNGKKKTKTIQLVILDEFREHITVAAGDHMPVLMGDVAEAINRGDEVITIKNKAGDDLDYTIKEMKKVRVSVHGVFFI